MKMLRTMIVLGLAGLAIVKARQLFATRFPAAKERVDKARERIEPALLEATKSVANAIGDAATEPSEAPSSHNVRLTS